MPQLFSTYKKLAKHRLSMLVSFSAMVGYLVAPGRSIGELVCLFWGVYFLSAGASALNQYQERNYDARMDRTRIRPIPSGELTAKRALLIALVLMAVGTILLALNSALASMLGLLNVVIYNFIYTPLKVKTLFSIFPGALVGAIPPMIGWVSAGAALSHPSLLFIALFMFFWQLPHFWLLLIKFGREYEKAGFSSISVYFTQRQIRHIVFFWAGVTSLFLFFFPLFGIKLPYFLATVLILLNVYFIFRFFKLVYAREEEHALRGAFILINSYLMIALIILVINSFL